MLRYKISAIKQKALKKVEHSKVYMFHYVPFRRSCIKKTVIFAQGRTGSTLLEHLLVSTGHFEAYGELFNTDVDYISNPYLYLSGLTKKRNKNNFIFHLKIYHLTRDRKKQIDPHDFLKRLNRHGWRIIYLYRKNKLNHYLSNRLTEKTGVYHKHSDEKVNVKLEINAEDLIKGLKNRMEFEKQERQVLRDLPYLEINYENDLEKSENHQLTVDKILDFLELEKRNSTTVLRKSNQMTQRELIKNYDEVKELLIKNEMNEFLT